MKAPLLDPNGNFANDMKQIKFYPMVLTYNFTDHKFESEMYGYADTIEESFTNLQDFVYDNRFDAKPHIYAIVEVVIDQYGETSTVYIYNDNLTEVSIRETSVTRINETRKFDH